MLHASLALASLLALPNASGAPAAGSVEAVFASLRGRPPLPRRLDLARRPARGLVGEGPGGRRPRTPRRDLRRGPSVRASPPAHRREGREDASRARRRILARRQDDRLSLGRRRWKGRQGRQAGPDLGRARGRRSAPAADAREGTARATCTGRRTAASIAVLFVEGSTQEPGALVAYKPDSGVVQEDDRGAAHRGGRRRSREAFARSRRPTSTSTTTIGRPTAGSSPRRPRRAPAPTTTGWRSSTRSRPPPGRPARSGNRPCRSRVRASRPTGRRSRSSTGS